MEQISDIHVHIFIALTCRDEYGKLYDFVSNKGLRVKNIGNNKVGNIPLYKFLVRLHFSADELWPLPHVLGYMIEVLLKRST